MEPAASARALPSKPGESFPDLIAASIYDTHSVGPSIRQFLIRCYLTMTDMIEVCSQFHEARVFIINTRPDKISFLPRNVLRGLSQGSILEKWRPLCSHFVGIYRQKSKIFQN